MHVNEVVQSCLETSCSWVYDSLVVSVNLSVVPVMAASNLSWSFRMSSVSSLRILWFCLLSSMTSGQAVISVARETTFIVHKPGQFTIFIAKTGQAQQTVTVVVEVSFKSIMSNLKVCSL